MVLCVEIKGFNPAIEELGELDGSDKPQEESSSDTTDVDEAGDIEELLNPGDPVYFNYATVTNVPPSITVSISIYSTTLYNVTMFYHRIQVKVLASREDLLLLVQRKLRTSSIYTAIPNRFDLFHVHPPCVQLSFNSCTLFVCY